MRLLIVGGSGFVGRNIVEQVAGGRHEFTHVTATYCRGTEFASWAGRLGVEPLPLDLHAAVKLPLHFDVAIYTAGNANHATAADQPVIDLELNARAMLNFLGGFRGRLINLSSGAVYYGLNGAVSPSRPLRPTFAYGISKLAAEMYIDAARGRGRLASSANVRLFYAFGRFDKPRRLVPRLLAAAAQSPKAAFRVNGTGLSYLDPLDAAFVAQVLLKLAARDGVEGNFDLCGGAPASVLAQASRIARIAGCDLKVEPSGDPEEFPVTFFASPRPLLVSLGIASPPPIEEGVQRAVEWMHETRPGR